MPTIVFLGSISASCPTKLNNSFILALMAVIFALSGLVVHENSNMVNHAQWTTIFAFLKGPRILSRISLLSFNL